MTLSPILPPLPPVTRPLPCVVAPLPPILPPLLPPSLPPLGHVITSKPGQQTYRETAQDRVCTSGIDWVQVVLTDGPNDQYARVELAAAEVPLIPGSLVPQRGTLHMLIATTGAAVYRWRV